jgi:ABC-2 type transport system ATP-binding protein
VSAISVRGLVKAYGDNRAVDGIDLHVDQGEVVAVLGPNGAGKTTTIEILEGFRTRDEGDVSVLGMDPATAGRELRDRIGIVLQESGIEDELTVAEALRHHALPYSRKLPVDQVIGQVGLGDKAGARIKTLSGGQRRRLDLALALVSDPDLIFLDEPTTGFDPAARRRSWSVIRSLAEAGKTILLTTHYLDEAQELADRVVVISGGRVVAEGTPDQIGGRSERPATIRFRARAEDARRLGLEANDGVVTISTTTPTEELHRITGMAIEAGIELEDLEVRRPTLEDTYLRLVGEEGGEE